MQTFDHVLFDLGGVLVDFRGISSLADRLGRVPDDMAAAWLASPAVRAYERGQIDTGTFVDRIRAELQLDLEDREFRSEMAGWLPGVLEGADDLVAELRDRGVVLSCLSNTNDLHWRRMTTWGVDGWFRHRVLSHEIGMVKPDAEIFEHACRTLAAPPDRVLFLDDHPANVAAAQRCGLGSERVIGPAAARQALEAAGLLG